MTSCTRRDRNLAPPVCSGDVLFRRGCAFFVILFSASIAALASHIIIDLLGDVLLVRDAYDHEAHGSRIIALASALLGGFCVTWRIVSSAFSAAQADTEFSHVSAAKRIVAGSSLWFVCRVTAMTVVMLAAMGALDTGFAVASLDDAGELLGGSFALGLSVSIVLSLAVGIGTLSFLRWLAASSHAIVMAVIALLDRIMRLDCAVNTSSSTGRAFSAFRSLSTLAELAGNRAPPPLRA